MKPWDPLTTHLFSYTFVGDMFWFVLVGNDYMCVGVLVMMRLP